MIFTIFSREFWRIVRSRGFIVGTLGTAAAVLLYLGVMSIATAMVRYRDAGNQTLPDQRLVGIVDDSGLLTSSTGILASTLPGKKFRYETQITHFSISEVVNLIEKSDDEEEKSATATISYLRVDTPELGRALIANSKISALLHIPKTYLENGVIFYQRKTASEEESEKAHSQHLSALREMLRDALLASLSKENKKRLIDGASFKSQKLDINGVVVDSSKEEEKEQKFAKFAQKGIPYVFSFLMLAIIFTNSSRLLNSFREERENKLIEVLLTSVSARELISGKVIGILCASLCQLGFWMAMVLIITALALRHFDLAISIRVDTPELLFSLVFTVLGMLFYGFFYAGLGGFKKDPNEENGLRILYNILKMIFAYALVIYLPSASSELWRLISTVPFLNPFLMPFQLMDEAFGLLDIALYLVLMSLCTFIMLQLSARLFRLRLMHRGESISDFQLMRKALRTEELA